MTAKPSPHGLRDLANQIERVAEANFYYSQAASIVRNCVEHLRAVAHANEQGHKIFALEQELERRERNSDAAGSE